MERCTAPDEPVDRDIDGSLCQPLGEGVEQKLRASIRVLLPSVQLVIDRKRDALLELAIGISRPADNITLLLQSHGHVEIFRDVML